MCAWKFSQSFTNTALSQILLDLKSLKIQLFVEIKSIILSHQNPYEKLPFINTEEILGFLTAEAYNESLKMSQMIS